MKKQKQMYKNIAVLLISFLICFLAVEGVLRVMGTYSFELTEVNRGEVAERWEEPFMTKSDIPGLLYELKKGAADTNAEGFRGPLADKTKDKLRIIALGDSVTHGMYALPYEASWPALLQKGMQTKNYDVEVINEGVIGYNTEQELIHFKNFGVHYNPDIVVLGYILNDFEEKVLAETDRDDLVIQVIPKERHITKYPLLPESIDKPLFDWFHFYRFANQNLGKFLSQQKTFSIGKEKNLAALKELKGLLDEKGIPLLVIVLPYSAYDNEESYPGKLLDLHKELADFFGEEGITSEDFFSLVTEYDMAKLRLDKYVHFNEEGNAVIASKIFKALEKHYPGELETAKQAS